jgi:hypothetical protein
MSSVPRDLGRLLRDARRGKTRIELDLKRLDTFGKQLDRSIDRATMGIMTASIVIGSSIVMTVQGGPQLFGMPVLTVLGFPRLRGRIPQQLLGDHRHLAFRKALITASSGPAFRQVELMQMPHVRGLRRVSVVAPA